VGSRVSLDEARLLFISACRLITVLPGVALVGQKPCAEPLLADAEIYIVSHSTDADAQVIIAGGDEEGITELFITGPRGIVDIDADFEERRTIGQADFQFDSTEPSLKELKRAYRAGRYKFSATTTDGCTRSTALSLSYQLLPAPVILFPGEGSTGVPTAGFTATWQAIAGAEAVRVQVEVEETAAAIAVDLPGDATSFHVPGDFLQPRVLYTMDVIGIAEKGQSNRRGCAVHDGAVGIPVRPT